MRPHHSRLPERILASLACVVILKTTASIVSNYPGYIPPDFDAEFLRGREGHFWGGYHWAFYAHILSGPATLILGLFLVGDRLRSRFPAWHRRLGWVQVALVLLVVTPSGLWMASRAAAGPVAGVGLASLAIATATCAALGVRAAVRRRFVEHRRWMWRCYLLLCSAVVLRLIGGFATVVGAAAPWFDPLATWASWLAPLVAFELRERAMRRSRTFERARPRSPALQPRPDAPVP